MLVKRTSRQLLAQQSESFNDSFEHNKKVLRDEMPSKKTRNKIAGYMAHVVRMQKDAAKKEAKRKAAAAVIQQAPQETPQYELPSY